MELIRAIRRPQVGDVLAVCSTDKGSRTDIPKWVEKAGHSLSASSRRDGYDEIVVEKARYARWSASSSWAAGSAAP